MCRQFRRLNLLCGHYQTDIEECETYLAGKSPNGQKKKGFWSGLFGKKLCMQKKVLMGNQLTWCTHCAAARGNIHTKDAELHTQPPPTTRRHLEAGPSTEQLDLTSGGIPSGLVNEYLAISSSQYRDQPRQQLPEIQSEAVDPGIDWERWSHARDHIIPPRPGPPPQKPLPPTPQELQRQTPAVRGLGDKTSSIPHNPVSERRGENIPKSRDHQVHNPTNPPSPIPAPHARRRNPPPWIRTIETDAGLPNPPWIPAISPVSPMSPSIPWIAESSSKFPETPLKRGGVGINRPREKPVKFQSPPLSLLIDNVTRSGPIPQRVPYGHAQIVRGRHELTNSKYGELCYISPMLGSRIDDVRELWKRVGSATDNGTRSDPVPQRVPYGQAQVVKGRHELTNSQYGEIGYISPMLGSRIDDVRELWEGVGSFRPEEDLQMPPRSPTNPARQQGNGKAKTTRRVTFGDFV